MISLLSVCARRTSPVDELRLLPSTPPRQRVGLGKEAPVGRMLALSFRAGSHRNESTLGLVRAWSSGLCPVSGARADQHDYRCVPANQRVVAVVWRMFIDRSVGIKRCLALL